MLIFVTFLTIGRSKTINTNKIDSRIVGGSNATKGQFPFYAQLLSTKKISESSNATSNCGGSIISSRYIMTAAHCVKNATLVIVILGFYTVDDRSGLYGRSVKSIQVHREYNATTMSNDIALIELNREIIFTDTIKPIRFGCDFTQPDTRTQITGTGLTNDIDKKLSPSLQWTNVTTISNERCRTFYSSIHSTNVCTIGKQKQGACHGDSGTPLINVENETQIQIGVLSWGALNRCELGYPSVFTRVSNYIDWIEEHANVTCINQY